MVNWQSSAEILTDSVVFSRFVHTLFGVYLWEVVTSLKFDWQFISGRKRFRWPLGFYFAGRYCLLFALVGILISLDVTEPVNCQALYTFNQVCGNAAIGLASVNLSLRTLVSEQSYRMSTSGSHVGPMVLSASWHPPRGEVVEWCLRDCIDQ